MCKKIKYIIISMMWVFSMHSAIAQIAMPDTVCIGATRVYHVNDPSVPSTYTWKIDGVTQSTIKNQITITWNKAGIFLLEVQEHSNAGCDGDIRSGLVYVKPNPVANAGPDATICFGATYQLSGSGGDLFNWTPSTFLSNPNVSNPFINATVPGVLTYVLSVANSSGCKQIKNDSVVITVLPPPKVFAGNDTSISIGQPLQLNALDVTNSNFVNYSWSPSSGLSNPFIKNPLLSFNNVTGNNGITYTGAAQTAEGCLAKDDIIIKVFIAPEIYVPNAFTPNGDGLNDVIRPICAGIKELKYFSIFNRFGQVVFTTTSQNTGWNGVFKGQRQNGDAFVWIARGVDYKGNIIDRKGTVILIR